MGLLIFRRYSVRTKNNFNIQISNQNPSQEESYRDKILNDFFIRKIFRINFYFIDFYTIFFQSFFSTFLNHQGSGRWNKKI